MVSLNLASMWGLVAIVTFGPVFLIAAGLVLMTIGLSGLKPRPLIAGVNYSGARLL